MLQIWLARKEERKKKINYASSKKASPR